MVSNTSITYYSKATQNGFTPIFYDKAFFYNTGTRTDGKNGTTIKDIFKVDIPVSKEQAESFKNTGSDFMVLGKHLEPITGTDKNVSDALKLLGPKLSVTGAAVKNYGSISMWHLEIEAISNG